MKELAEVIEDKHAFPVSAREWESGPRQETATCVVQEELNSAVDGQKRQRRWGKGKDDDQHSEAKWGLTIDGRKYGLLRRMGIASAKPREPKGTRRSWSERP